MVQKIKYKYIVKIDGAKFEYDNSILMLIMLVKIIAMNMIFKNITITKREIKFRIND